MQANNWQIAAIIIAAIITAVGAMLGPCLAVIVKSRIDQPKPAPKTAQPKLESQRQNSSFRRLIRLGWKRFLFSWLASVPCSAILVSSFMFPVPATSRLVVVVSLAAAVYVGLSWWMNWTAFTLTRDMMRGDA